MNTWVGFVLGILMAGMLLQLALGRWLSPRAKGWLAFLAGLAALAGMIALLVPIAGGKKVDAVLFAWDPAALFQVRVDGLSLVFGLMAAGIGSAILLYCIDYMAHESGTTRFYALMLTFIAGLIGLVVSANLLTAYLCWEVIGLCSYLLVGFWYKDSAATQGARKVLLMTHIPGYALLLGILLLYHGSGTFLWTDTALGAQFTTGIFLLMLVAAMAKSVMFPLHTWIPEAMNAPTPVSALLHSACYVKAGIYLVARLYSIIQWQPGWNTLVIAVGCVTMLVGALNALAQTDLKRLLAFSTISQLGYIVTALGIGTPLGAAAGLFYVFSHGLYKGTLFLCSGAVQHAAGTRDLRLLGGLSSRMPRTTSVWLIAAAAIIGVPLTNGFVAKWLLYDAALESGAWAAVIVAWLVSVLTAFYILKATVGVFYGKMPAELAAKEIHEASPRMLTGMSVLAGLCVLFGIAPQILMKYVSAPGVAALGFDWQVNLTYLGIHTVSAGAPVTAGALLAIIALGVAAFVFLAARPHPTSTPLFTGGDPLPEDNSLNAEDYAEFAEETFKPVLHAADPDPLYLLLWRGIKSSSRGLNTITRSYETRPWLAAVAAAVVLVVIIWLL